MENKYQMQKHPSTQHEEEHNHKVTFANTSTDPTVETLMKEVENSRKALESRDRELLRMKKDLEQAKKHFEQIFHEAPVGYVVYDDHLRLHQVNRTFHNMLQVEESVVGKSFPFFIHPESQDSFYSYHRALIAGQAPQGIVVRLVAPNERYARLSSNRVKEAEGWYVRTTIEEVTDLYRKQRRIEYLSFHDQLTGLFNRHFFEEKVRQFDHSSQLPITLITADVDGLKIINDAYGSNKGNLVLKTFAIMIKENLHPDYISGRMGGDEFMVLMPRTTNAEGHQWLTKIKDSVKRQQEFLPQLSVSFGMRTKTAEDERFEELAREAEKEMNHHKLLSNRSRRRQMVDTIMKTLHAKSPREELHSQRVSYWCKKMGETMDLSSAEITTLETAGLFHDIGKIGVDEAVLNKPGRLNESEWLEIQRHSEVGYRILAGVYDFGGIADLVLAHHERYDGKGYPNGLAGNQIPKLARIITIVDAFDAMTRSRSYREAFDHETAAREILANAGTQFDPILARVFVEQVVGYRDSAREMTVEGNGTV